MSIEDALREANERARRVASAIEAGRQSTRYSYGDRPLREEIIEELSHDGEVVVVLTRNAYGSIVLNTAKVLFADIDFQPSSLTSVLGRAVAKLLGRQVLSQDKQVMNRIEQFVSSRPGLGMRLYRTANGFRCLIKTNIYSPTDKHVIEMLQELESDPLYVRLCQAQTCFRARLSPKCWRCGVSRPPVRFPWSDSKSEQQQREWEKSYRDQTVDYAVCALIGDFGSSDIHPAVEPILKLHDELACTVGPLA